MPAGWSQRRRRINDDSGIRVSRTGMRFRIESATEWIVLDDTGRRVGQAATCDRWTPL